MTPPAITQLVQPVIMRYRSWQLWRGLSLCWALSAVVALFLIAAAQSVGWRPDWALQALLGFAALSGLLVWASCRRIAPDLRWIARQVEDEHPELNSLLLAAVEQQPDESGRYSYLQQRVIREAIEHAARSRWAEKFSRPQQLRAQVAHWLSLTLMGAMIVIYATPGAVSLPDVAAKQQPGTAAAPVPPIEVRVEPGNIELERGRSLVAMARFGERVPADVNLVIHPGTEAARIIPMVKSLKDPTFGATVPGVERDFTYQVTFAEGSSETFKVHVYEHPRLERSNVEIDYPDYTGLDDQRIENTRRVTAVEGSRISLELELNKPVEHAALVSPDETIELETDGKKASATLSDYALRRKNQFKLVLRDADGRTNKVASRFVFVALGNRPPEVKFLFPKGDQRVSALEEIEFEIQAYDDFGLKEVGLSYHLAGRDPVNLVLATNAPARKKLKFSKLVSLEELDARPDNLLTYHLWAVDTGPDGRDRRIESDIYFAEVRPFDMTFSEVENQGQAGQRQQQGQNARLAELLKEITSAGWKLRRLEYDSEEPAAQKRL